VAVSKAGLVARLPRSFNPPYECAEISAKIERPFSDTTLYTDGDAVPPGTLVCIIMESGFSRTFRERRTSGQGVREYYVSYDRQSLRGCTAFL